MRNGKPVPEVVFLPGLMCTPAVFGDVPQRVGRPVRIHQLVASSDFEAIAIDVLEALPAPSVLCGLSMGAYVALRVAILAPDLVSGLILIGGAAASDSSEQAAMRRKVVDWSRRKGLAALAAAQADGLLAQGRAGRSDLRMRIAEMGQDVGLETFALHQAALAARPDMTGDLAKIRCPTLVLTGSEDRINGPEVARIMAASMPRADFVEVGGAGHLPTLEAPEDVGLHVVAAVDRFVREAA